MSSGNQDTSKRQTESFGPSEAPTEKPGNEGAVVAVILPCRFGDFELLEEIARGGMGVVFKARQTDLERLVALKMILSGQLASASDVQRFRAEATAAAGLDHPCIVPIYEIGEHQGQHYFSMKFIEGGSLAQRLAESPRMAIRSLVDILIQVARAVHHAHEHGILHRDLKPANILLDRRGAPFVTDFGLARRVNAEKGLTQSGAIVGTPSYMAPEQARGAKQLTAAVDVYSLGAILYQMLTGRPPFQAATPLDTVLQLLEREPEPPCLLDPSVDPELEAICLQCLEKDPRQRYDSAAALADDLERWHDGKPIQARMPGRAWRLILLMKRKRLVLLGILLMVVLAGIFNWYVHKADERYRELLIQADMARQQKQYDLAEVLVDQSPGLVRDARAWRLSVQIQGDRQHDALMSRVSQAWSKGEPFEAEAFLDQCHSERRDAEWHAWKDSLLPPLQVITTPGWNAGVAFSADGKRLVLFDTIASAGIRVVDTTNWNGVLHLDVNAGGAKGAGEDHDQPKDAVDVTMVVFSPKADFLAAITNPTNPSTNSVCQVRVWALDRPAKPVSISSPGVRRVAFSDDGRLRLFGYVAWPAQEIVEWDPSGGRERTRFSVMIAPAPPWSSALNARKNSEALAFSADGQRFARGGGNISSPPAGNQPFQSQSLSAQRWDTATGKEQPWPVRVTPAGSFTFTPDLRLLAGHGEDWTRHVWDMTTGKDLCRLSVPSWFETIGGAGPSSAVFSPDGRHLAMATPQYRLGPGGMTLEDQPPEVRVWEVSTGRQTAHLRALRSPVTGRSTFPNQLVYWGPYTSLAWHPDSRRLAVATRGEVRIFDVAPNE
jgi:WD40 repeat protein